MGVFLDNKYELIPQKCETAVHDDIASLGRAVLGLQNHNRVVKTATFLEFWVSTFNTEHSHSPLLHLSNIFMYSWEKTSKYYRQITS